MHYVSIHDTFSLVYLRLLSNTDNHATLRIKAIVSNMVLFLSNGTIQHEQVKGKWILDFSFGLDRGCGPWGIEIEGTVYLLSRENPTEIRYLTNTTRPVSLPGRFLSLFLTSIQKSGILVVMRFLKRLVIAPLVVIIVWWFIVTDREFADIIGSLCLIQTEKYRK